MSRNRFERSLPWSAVVAAGCWVAQMFVGAVGETDEPGAADVAVMQANALPNTLHVALLVTMAIALVFLAAWVRGVLRGTEAGEASASQVAFGGWLLVAAALAQSAVMSFSLTLAAADADQAATTAVGYLAWPGWLAMMVGLSAALLATGYGGLRGGSMPRWFAVATLVLGGFVTLGALHIPPGGLVTYLLLGPWLVVAALATRR